MVKDTSDVLRYLVEIGATTRAGRLAGAFRNNGQADFADEILRTMKEFGYKVVETDPFISVRTTPYRPEISPYAARIRQMWANMREQVIENFLLSLKIQLICRTIFAMLTKSIRKMHTILFQ